MSKRKLEWNDAKIKRYLNEKRGQGEGYDYKPWLTIQDFPSLGRASRIKSMTTGRIHHFFSKTQRDYFMELDWEESIIDIREHYPLLDYKETIENLDDLNQSKFGDGEIDYVITTTFLVTKRIDTDKVKYFARSVKYASELDKKITLEKLEIERRYWSNKSINWGLVTNKEINTVLVKNIEFINPVVSSRLKINKQEEITSNLISEYTRSSDKVLYGIFKSIDRSLNLNPGESITVFKYLLANRFIQVDMNSMIDIRKPIELDFRRLEDTL